MLGGGRQQFLKRTHSLRVRCIGVRLRPRRPIKVDAETRASPENPGRPYFRTSLLLGLTTPRKLRLGHNRDLVSQGHDEDSCAMFADDSDVGGDEGKSTVAHWVLQKEERRKHEFFRTHVKACGGLH